MASAWFNKGKASVLNHAVDLLADVIKVVLLDSTYSFNVDHNFISDVVAHEVSGSGYVGGFAGAGRKTLASKTVTQDNSADAAFFDADDVLWTTVSIGTVGWAVLVKEITNDGASILIAALDINPDAVTSGANLTVAWNALGILKLA